MANAGRDALAPRPRPAAEIREAPQALTARRPRAATHGIAEENAAIAHGLRAKAEGFRKSGGEIYRRA